MIKVKPLGDGFGSLEPFPSFWGFALDIFLFFLKTYHQLIINSHIAL